MNNPTWIGLLGGLLSTMSILAQNTLPSPAAELPRWEAAGEFTTANRAITAALEAGALPPAEAGRLAWERERLHRIQLDYSDTRETLFHDLQGAVRDLTRAEFEGWIQAGWFDRRVIDGVEYFFGSSVSNLFFRHPELNPRRLKSADPAFREQFQLQEAREIRAAARAAGSPYVLPHRFQVTMTVTVKSNAVPAGEDLRVWVPIPRRYPHQTDFHLLAATPAARAVGAEDQTCRSVYFETPARGAMPTEFRVDYDFTTRGVCFDLDPARSLPVDPADPALRPFLAEGPHVVFTPALRELSARILGGETNALRRARLLYEWPSDHLLYSYAREYSTLTNISDYCRAQGYGDCGQQALLFIALCRLNGIPARWQSGWNLLPRDTTNHDWAEIYLAPWGWLPVDPYMGNWAMRYTRTLTEPQKREIRDFYFGGLDHYRMAANADHNAPLDPPKSSVRSDDVDFQRGEIEAGGRNLYFNQFSYHLEWREPATP